MTLEQYEQELKDLGTNFDEVMAQAVKKGKSRFMFKFKRRLYLTGTDGTGNPFSPKYSKVTVKLKKGKGQTTSHVTLRDSGQFYKSMFLQYLKKAKQLFVSSTNKGLLSKLNAHYKTDVLSINQEEKKIATADVQAEFNKIIKKLNSNTIN